MRDMKRAVYGVPAFSPNDQWKAKGLCRSEGEPRWWFPEPPFKAAKEKKAVEICQRCPIREKCRDEALAARETAGVWGAMTEAELRELVGKAGQ